MSKSHEILSSKQSNDLWTINENLLSSESISNSLLNAEDNLTILFVGDSFCGKTSLIQGFLKPNTSMKDPKPTVALEYNFARKKGSTNNNSSSYKIIANMWELGGENRNEAKLIELPICLKNIEHSTIILCVDLTKTMQILESTTHWIQHIQNIITKVIGISKKTLHRKVLFEGHVDETKVSPYPIPLYIFANKYDIWKTLPQAEKRLSLQILRFVAHYYGATLIATSIVEPTMKESFRGIMSNINFNGTIKSTYETSVNRPFFISAGMDSFEKILLGHSTNENENTTFGKSKLASSVQELPLFIGASGPTSECWSRLANVVVDMFGQPESFKSKETETHLNDHPESEIDSMRAQYEITIARYIHEKERKEATIMKMNSSTTGVTTSKDNNRNTTDREIESKESQDDKQEVRRKELY